MTGLNKITPEVSTTSTFNYLVRIDGEVMFYFTVEDEAKSAVDSIAAAEVSRLESKWTAAYRNDAEKNVTISTRALGRVFNGSVVTEMVIDYIVVCLAVITDIRKPLAKKPIPEEDQPAEEESPDTSTPYGITMGPVCHGNATGTDGHAIGSNSLRNRADCLELGGLAVGFNALKQ